MIFPLPVKRKKEFVTNYGCISVMRHGILEYGLRLTSVRNLTSNISYLNRRQVLPDLKRNPSQQLIYA